MDQNLISRPSAANSPKPFSIRLDPIPVNEKAVYVESVCAVLIESRFGPGRSRPVVIDLRKLPEREATVIYDLTVGGPVPSYSILPDSEMARRYMADAVRRKLTQVDSVNISIHIQPLSPSTMARGSPQISH